MIADIEHRTAIHLFISTFSLALFKRNNVFDNTYSVASGQTHFVAAHSIFSVFLRKVNEA